MSAEGLVQVPFSFEDIAVYFSEEEWNLLREKQKELYKSTMMEHYETLMFLGFLTCKPGIIRRIESGEELFFVKSENEEKVIANEALPSVDYQACNGKAKTYEGETPIKSTVAVISKSVIEAVNKQSYSNKKANITVQKTPDVPDQDSKEKLSDSLTHAASNKENSIERSAPPSTHHQTLTDNNKIAEGELSPLSSCLRTDSRENVLKGEAQPFPNHQCSHNKEKIIQGMKVLIRKHPLSNVRRKRTLYGLLPPIPEEPPSKEVTAVQGEVPSVEHQTNGETESDSNRLSISNGETLTQEVSSFSSQAQSVTVEECVGELQTSSTEQQEVKSRENIDIASTENWSRRKCRKSNREHIELRKNLPRKPKEAIVYYLQREEAGEQQKKSVHQRSFEVLANGCKQSFVKLIDFLQHQKISKEKKHSCSVCKKRFLTRTALAHHMKIHTGARPYACSECPKRFRQSSHLVAHHQNVHARLRPYKCTVCGKSFAQKGNLLTHKNIHTGEKPFICNVCAKTFSRTEVLKVHMRTHTGVRPYSCLECGNSFRHSATLVAHQRKHTGEKPYVCTECGRGFTRYETLSGHKRLHTGEKPYACSECGRRFTQSESLVIHQRTHTGEKPYTCTECGKCFRHSASLVGHRRIHTGERPYKCSQCDKTFNQASSLRLHLQFHARQRHRCKECGKSFKQLSELNDHMLVHRD